MEPTFTVLRTLPVLAALLFAPVSGDAAAHVEPASGPDITLALGEGAVLPEVGARLVFVEVVEDSRCPRGVNCVWAGNARVRLRLEGADDRSEFTLNTNPEFVSGLTSLGIPVTLLAVSPYPDPGASADRSAYRITLRIGEPVSA